MHFLLIILSLFSLLLLYFKVANKYNIIDKPNHRSAHTEITLRGGGIVVWFASLLYFVQNTEANNTFFFVGITTISLVSFWDDIQSLSNKVRLLAHFLAITLVFFNLNLFALLPFWTIPLVYILFIGIINAYNFMDGINGITGVYTLSVLGSFWYVNQQLVTFTASDFIIYPMLASLVFLFFNFRKKAKCFAGDIGSIAIAFWVVFLLLKLVLITNSVVWILFLAVYGTDTFCTILHRLYLRENIFEAHRHHFYQILSNEYKIDHRLVAASYALVQLAVCFVIITQYQKTNTIALFACVCSPLLLIYVLKFYLLKKKKAN